MPQPSAPADSRAGARPYRLARLIGATTLLIAVLAAATAAMLYVSLQDTLRQEKTNLRNLAIAFSAQTFSVAQAIDGVMREAEREHRAHAGAFTDVGENSIARDYLLGIYLYDAGGRLLAGGAPLKARAAEPPAAAEVGAALAARSGPMRVAISGVNPRNGRGVINFSRLTRDAAGRTSGVIVAQADTGRFEQIYSLVELGKGGSVTLLQRDGTMLVRAPAYPAGIGKSFAQTQLFQRYLPASARGAFAAVSPLDGQPRLYGYDAVGDYPLVMITGRDRGEALAAWYGRLWTALVSLALVALAVMLMAWRVARDARRQSTLIGKLAASEAQAENSADYLAAILNAVGTPIWVLDSARKIVMFNQAFSRFVGRGAAELTGLHESDAFDPANAGERDLRYRQVLHGAQGSEAITQIVDGAGAARTVIQLTSKLHDAAGQAQVVSVLTDITARQKAERRLAYIANFDPLTGLPNQGQLRRMLAAELAGAAARRRCVGTLVVSLERVREISDLLGHAAGESALQQVAEVFRSLLPHAGGVARIKGSEFALIIETAEGREFLEQYAIELKARLSAPLKVDGREFFLGPVIGVSVFPEDGADADQLLRCADSARSRAVADVGGAIHFFSARAQTDLDERLAVEAQLRRALERDELRLVFQPKVQIASGRIVGFETLLRWSNPVLGEVPPVRFIPIAERTGLIIEIGAWVLQQACLRLHEWQQAGAAIKLAVNLSPRQFHQTDLLPMIRRCTEPCALAAGSLELEITEGALMSREQEVDLLMHDIRALGIELSIDDFGTGYSSLAYLKRFPVQRLKVDRAFIRDLGRDDDSAAIARSIVNLAHGLKLAVVAEGVETAQQLAILRAMGCDEYQGFLFSRPVDAGAVLALFEQNRAACG